MLKVEPLTANLVRELCKQTGGIRLSCYLPVFKDPQQADQNLVRLRKAREQAASELAAQGMTEETLSDWLAPLTHFENDPQALLRPGDAIALMIGPEARRLIDVDLPVEPRVHVGGEYFVKPLVPALNEDASFYLLALARNNTRLYRGGRCALERVQVADLPQALADVVWVDDPERSTQHHTSVTRSGQGTPGTVPGATVHGQGTATDKQNEQNERFNATVGRELAAYLSNKPQPLIVIGDEQNIGELLKDGHFENRTVKTVKHNPDNLDGSELFDHARTAIEPILEKQRQAILSQINAADPNLVTHSVKEAALAAVSGRIELCTVASDAFVNGVVNLDSNEVRIFDEGESHDAGANCVHDLLDTIAQRTIAHGGIADARPAAEIPGESHVAVLLRY
jgi:hypothetical protein